MPAVVVAVGKALRCKGFLHFKGFQISSSVCYKILKVILKRMTFLFDVFNVAAGLYRIKYIYKNNFYGFCICRY